MKNAILVAGLAGLLMSCAGSPQPYAHQPQPSELMTQVLPSSGPFQVNGKRHSGTLRFIQTAQQPNACGPVHIAMDAYDHKIERGYYLGSTGWDDKVLRTMAVGESYAPEFSGESGPLFSVICIKGPSGRPQLSVTLY